VDLYHDAADANSLRDHLFKLARSFALFCRQIVLRLEAADDHSQFDSARIGNRVWRTSRRDNDIPIRMTSFDRADAASRGAVLSPLPGKDVTVRTLHPELAPSAVLFHLAFMGQAVVKDLDHLKQRSPEGTGLEIALRLGEAVHERQAPARIREIDKYFTADSDPS